MFEFSCPTCGKRVQGDDASSGQAVRCPACNATMIAPGSFPAAISEQAPKLAILPVSNDGTFREGEPPLPLPPQLIRRVFFAWMRRPATWIIAAVIVMTAAGVVIPVVQEVRAKAMLAQSSNNLKDIGLAFNNFHDANKRLPFNGDAPAQRGDRTSGSWAFQILPFVDQAALFVQPDVVTGVPTFMCPGRGRPLVSTTGAWTDYFINPWLNDPINGRPNGPDASALGSASSTAPRIRSWSGTDALIQHCIPQTLRSLNRLISSKAGIRQWRAHRRPIMPTRRTILRLDWGGPLAGGALMCMCDGVVRMFPYELTGNRLTSFLDPIGEVRFDGPPDT